MNAGGTVALAWFAGGLATGLAALAAEQVPDALPWRWSNPLPHGNNVYDLAFGGGQYWQATDRGRIYVSEDRLIWASIPSGTTNTLRGIAFRNEEVLICGAYGTLLSGSSSSGFQRAVLVPPTTDWLEAVAVDPASNVAVAVGDNAAVYRNAGSSPTWERLPNVPFSDWLRGVAYGAGKFVAVGENGRIALSTDGTLWDEAASGVSTHLNRVAFQEDAIRIAGDEGVLLESFNGGTSWLRNLTGKTNDFYALAEKPAVAGSGASLLLAAGDNALLLRTATDSGWSDQLADGSPLPAPAWPYFASVWDGERFVVAGRTGLVLESFQTNAIEGTLWFEEFESPRDWLWDVMALPELCVAVGDRATILTSPNGRDWYREFVPSAATNAVFLGVAGTSNLLVTVGTGGQIAYSPNLLTNIITTNDVVVLSECRWATNTVVVTNEASMLGLLWVPVDPSLTTNTLQGVCERLGEFVIVGDNGTVLSGTNGSDWTLTQIAGEPNLSSVAPLESGYISSGDNGAIYFSANGLSWQERPSGTANWIYRVRNLGGRLIGVGERGTILTSEDGLDWMTRTSGTEAWLADVAMAPGRYFICGTQGTILTSTDSTNWTALPMITGKSLYGLALRKEQLLTVGVEGIILRLLLDPVYDVQITRYQHDECEDFLADRFAFEGLTDQRFSLELSIDLESWNPVAMLEFEDDSLEYTLIRTNEVRLETEYFRAVSLSGSTL
jgi:hypothetical protein